MIETSTTDLTVEADGMRMAVRTVRRAGPVRGTILIVNGVLSPFTALRWTIKSLPEFDLILFDFPPIGLSRPLNPRIGRLTEEQEAELVLALIARFEPEYLISISWGGASALTALAAQPKSIRRAIIASYALGMSEHLRGLASGLLELIDGGRRDEAATHASNMLAELLPERLRRVHKDYYLGLDEVQVQHVVDHARYCLSASTDRIEARLKAIRIPVLFANGAADRLTPPSAVDGIERHLPQAEFAVIPDAGHFLAMESKDAAARVRAMVEGFFA
ncbi:MAG: alpha/beta hydrolase [Proteobacteria bacterium]|nr:alpha/beta hydrolase [Pseudomonadota bacterium]